MFTARIVESPLPSTSAPSWEAGCGAEAPCPSGDTSAAKISLPILHCHKCVWGPARFTSLPHLPSLLGSFFMSLVIGVLFSYFSGGPQGWLFYNLVVIFMWSWEMASIAFTYFVILTRSFICLFYYNRPSGYKVVSHYGLNLHFSDDK